MGRSVPFQTTYISICALKLSLFFLSFVGVEHLFARIVHTLIIIPAIIVFAIKFYRYIVYVFDNNKENDINVSFVFFLDIIISYLFISTLILITTWVWFEDIFFQVIRPWNTMSPLESYIHHFYITIAISFGTIPAVHVPKEEFIYSYVLLIVMGIFSYVGYVLVFAFSASLIQKRKEQDKTSSTSNTNNNDYRDVSLKFLK